MATVDSGNGDIPYESPSNKSMQITGTCLADGTEVILGPDEANYLNGQGIVTALNFIGGWKAWGNRTACYPSNTDPKDAFISIRRMFNWHAQTFIQTYWAKVDKPINKRLIQTVVDSENIRLNGLVAQGSSSGRGWNSAKMKIPPRISSTGSSNSTPTSRRPRRRGSSRTSSSTTRIISRRCLNKEEKRYERTGKTD